MNASKPALRTLSIVIPAYNEAACIGALLTKVLAVDLPSVGVEREVIVVDDGSRDATSDIASSFPGVRVHKKINGGKGSAVRAGLALATGDYVLIQDGDLEYEPADYLPMIAALRGGRGDVVYGSRYLTRPDAGMMANLMAGKHGKQSWTAYLGGQSLSFVCLAMTGRYLTDTVTAYKMFPRALLTSLALETNGFELDHEITAKVLARGAIIAETPIRYAPRSKAEGKKIRASDWFRAVRTFTRFRRG